jgi:hypothetical protein
MIKASRAGVHRCNLEGIRIEEGKSKVDMSKASEIEVFGLDLYES